MTTLHDQQLENGLTDTPERNLKKIIITINLDGNDISKQFSYAEDYSNEEIIEIIGEKAGDMIDSLLTK